MDNNKKQQQNYTRASNSKACQSADSNRKCTDIQASKPCPKNSRRREQTSAPRNDPQRNSKQSSSAKVRPNVDKRPRPRGGGGDGNIASNYYDTACATADLVAGGTGLAATENAYGVANGGGAVAKSAHYDYELNSVYAPGSKKQNLNHLLNFHYTPRESDYATMNLSVFGRGGNGGGAGAGNMYRHNQGGVLSKKHRYNKEQFLQANFQFVIKSSAKPQLTASPDTLIEWDLIEQINIHTTEEPQCPICLYPPIAAKMTRCGHAYCWPCILHYLALSDKKWRKCPICYEAIHTTDLKSTTIVQQLPINVDGEITFQLMRRKKGSMYIEKFTTVTSSVEHYPQVSSNAEMKLFSKFLIAKRADILEIIERERRELMTDEDSSCPEFVFIQQALDILNERREKLGEIANRGDDEQEPEPMNDRAYAEMPSKAVEMQSEALEAEVIITDEAETSSISSASDSISNTTTTISNNATKYYYFYQSVDGQNIYLHPLNVKMLQACYGTLDRAPPLINARILQKEHHSMDEDRRRKFTCLAHLPLTCQFAVVEVELQAPVVSESILKLFKNDLLFRKKERQRRNREESKREKHINEINDRQMGKLIASATNLNLSSSHEFPTCGFEEPLFEIGALNGSIPTAIGPPISTPSAPIICSYSTVAVTGGSPNVGSWSALDFPSTFNSGSGHHSANAWGKPNAGTNTLAAPARRAVSTRPSESDPLNEWSSLDAAINLSDVLAEAISQKKQNASAAAVNGQKSSTKKNKRTKKMMPVFTTGMNFNGN